MNKKHSSLINFLLSAAVAASSLGLAACHDNDLDGNGGSSSTGEVTEQNYEKYDALSCLLGVVAEVDSLPQNWDADGFTAEPTLGEVVDASQPYVRYVATTSTEEAYREYRSMIAAGVDGTVQNEKWEQTGIGSMEFKAENQSDLYATLNVNVKQLPHLTQIRFVPASALGSNADDDKVPFYQYGDVVKQMVGDKLTYWVCVRPCDYKSGLKKSHWCSFQLVPKGKANSNYKVINDDVVLPTKLCSSYGEGQRMTQNFFNVMRVIRMPQYYHQEELKDQVGIDKISYNTFGYKQAKALKLMWEELGLWKKIPNEGFSSNSNEDNPYNLLEANYPALSAYYYGYKSVFFKKYDYGVYKLNLSINTKASGIPLFNAYTPSLAEVYADREHDYTAIEREANNKEYIVKYRTGAELEDSWGNDDASTTSFEDRNASNKINDVLVWRNRYNWKPSDEVAEGEQTHLPFFSFGDIVSKSVSHAGYQMCIKEANDGYLSEHNEEKKKAFFICFKNDYPELFGAGVELSEQMESIVLYQCLLSIAYGTNTYLPEFTDQDGDSKDVQNQKAIYRKSLLKLYHDFIVEYGRNFFDIAMNNHSIKVTAKFLSGSKSLTYDYKKNTYKFADSEIDSDSELKTLKFCSYDDNYSYQESFTDNEAVDIDFNQAASRREMRSILNSTLENFLEKCIRNE